MSSTEHITFRHRSCCLASSARTTPGTFDLHHREREALDVSWPAFRLTMTTPPDRGGEASKADAGDPQ